MLRKPDPSRIPCCVPFCGRTFKRTAEDTDSTELMCGKHYRLSDPGLRRRRALVVRRWKRELDQDRSHRLAWLAHRMWQRIKRQAIERAAGISG